MAIIANKYNYLYEMWNDVSANRFFVCFAQRYNKWAIMNGSCKLRDTTVIAFIVFGTLISYGRTQLYY